MTAHTEREGLRAHVRDLERQIARLRAENMAARDRALEEAARKLGPPNAPTLQLHCGEMSAEDVRLVVAVLIWMQGEIRALKGTKP